MYTFTSVGRQHGQTQKFVGECDERGGPGESTRPESSPFSWAETDDGSLTAAQP